MALLRRAPQARVLVAIAMRSAQIPPSLAEASTAPSATAPSCGSTSARSTPATRSR